ncbi:hypothetical protein EVG20_g2867 [Dentipellis fragilis]|uniref:Uncharacterized protein n=1 Tax=Dentipellis fragilis TaxID=205917 RepID=A0A4Y9Z9R4_9AGAM|nr:hypothetical protein EVG20_g2867 [Dentipellis fragilis]
MYDVDTVTGESSDSTETVSFLRSIEVGPDTGVDNWIRSVKISPQGDTIASASANLVHIWNSATGNCIATLRDHKDWVLCTAYSPDGALLLSGSLDASIRIWVTNSWTSIGQPLKPGGGPVRDIAFSPDGSHFMSACVKSSQIVMWSSESLSRVGESVEGHDKPVHCVDFAPDGLSFASGCHDGSIALWRTATRSMLRRPFFGHIIEVNQVKFSPDGSKLASASEDSMIRLWDAATGNPLALFEGHGASVRAIAFSPLDGMLISGSVDKSLRLWDPEKKITIGGPVEYHNMVVTGVDVSREGSLLVSSSYDCSIGQSSVPMTKSPRKQ